MLGKILSHAVDVVCKSSHDSWTLSSSESLVKFTTLSNLNQITVCVRVSVCVSDFYSSSLQCNVLLDTVCVVFYFKLCVYVCPLVSLTPPLYLSLPSRSCHSDLSDGLCFVVCRCLSGEGGQSGAAGRGAKPQAEQPAAAGGVAEHSGPPHQSHRAAVQRQQALLASQAHTQSRTMPLDTRSSSCIFAKANAHTYSPEPVYYHSMNSGPAC